MNVGTPAWQEPKETQPLIQTVREPPGIGRLAMRNGSATAYDLENERHSRGRINMTQGADMNSARINRRHVNGDWKRDVIGL